MKITVHTKPPANYEATPEIRIFAPIDDPSLCVMCQRWRESGRLLVNPATVWVAVQTERVDKITFAATSATKSNEQIQNQHPRRD